MRYPNSVLTVSFALLLCLFHSDLTAQDAPAPDKSNLLQVSDPGIAAQLKLTPEQSAKIAELLKQHEEQLAAAKPEEKEQISAEILKQLAETLTEEQRKTFEEINSEPKLVFNFRYQRWSDVLDWFANQANLSLTMDAPPPGTFNYTDKKEYTPSEAIDLLNGVLQTKSFTLVRRNKMLLVLDISEGIPESLIPKVSLEEIDKKGQFEYVTTVFPMNGRNVNDAKTEIDQLLGKHGKAVVLGKTNQLMVTEMAGKMRAFQAIIESLPVPKPAPPKPPEKKPDPPELKSYPITLADPEATIEMLTKLFGDIKAVYDPKTKQLSAFTVPAQQAAIQKVIEQLQAGQTATAFELTTYDMTNENPPVLMENIQLVLPEVRLRHDAVNNTLIAWASPEDQKKIKETIEKLSQNKTGDKSLQFEIYSTKGMDATTALTSLQTLFPHVKISMEPNSDRLIVMAPATVHQGISAILDQFREAETKKELPELRFYPYDSTKLPASVTQVLSEAVKDANVRIDTEAGQLVVLATGKAQAKIEEILKKYTEATTQNKKSRKLEIYPVNKLQFQRLTTMLDTLRTEFPGINIVPDAQTGEVAVWATEEQQKILVSILEKLKSDKEEDRGFELATYPLKKSEPTSVLAMMQNLYPGTQILLDTSTNRLLVWTTSEEQKSIAQSVQKLVADQSPDQQTRLEKYSITGMTGAELVSLLQPLVPSARLSVDPKTDSLIAWATPDDQKTIEVAVAGLQKENTPQNTPQLEVYKLTQVDPNTTLNLLQGLFPSAKLSLDPQTQSLIAIAKPADLNGIKNTIAEIQPDKSGPNSEKLQFHPLSKKPSDNLITVIQSLVPRAKLTLETDSKRIMAVATEEDQERIKATIEKIENATGTTKQELEIYPVTPAQKKRFMAVYDSIQGELPGMRVVTDAEPGELSIWAKPEQHEMLKEIISKLSKKLSKSKKYVLVAYPLNGADPTSAIEIMTNLFPETKVVLEPETERLMIWTSPEQHEMIQQAMDQITAGKGSETTKNYKTYPIKKANISIIAAVVREMFPRISLTEDATANSILIRAKKEDHEKISELIKELDQKAGSDSEVRVYPYGSADGYSILNVISRLVPLASVNVDLNSANLYVYGSAEDQKIVTETMKKIVGEEVKTGPRIMKIYKLKTIPVSNAQQVITNVVPQARIIQGYDSKKMIVWAYEHDIKKIDEIVPKIDTDDKPKEQRVLAIIPLNGISYNMMMSLLDAELKNECQFIEDVAKDSVIIRGKEYVISKVRAAITDMVKALPLEEKPVLKSYTTTSIDTYLAMGLLQATVPSVSFSFDANNQKILARGIPADHEKVVEALKLIDTKAEGENAPFLQGHDVSSKNFTTIYDLITNAFATEKGHRISQDTANNRLIVFGTEEQQQKVDEIIKKFDTEETGAFTELYKLKHTTPNAVWDIVRYLVPNARITWSGNTNILYSYASQEDQARVKELVLKMDVPDDQQDASLKIYSVPSDNFTSLYNMITNIMSKEQNYQITPDERNQRLIILASEKQHEKIANALSQMKEEGTKSHAEIYTLNHVPAQSVSEIIRNLAPYAVISQDTTNNKLIIYANDVDHAKIQSVIATTDVESAENQPRVISYKVSLPNVNTAYTMIYQLMAGKSYIQVTPDNQNGRVVVFATEEDHKKIAEALKEIDKDVEESFTEVYQLKHTIPSTISTVVTNLVPGIKVSVDNENRNLIIQGTEEEHQKINELIAKVDVIGTDAGKPYLVAYPVSKADPDRIQSILQNTIRSSGDVAVSADPQAGTVVVWAKEAQHEEISKLLKQFEEVTPGVRTDVYQFKVADPNSAISPLSSLTPRARIAVDSRTRSLIVTATDKDHKLITEAITKLDNKDASGQGAILKIYTIENAEPYNTLSMLQTLFAMQPEVRLTVDMKNKSIAAVALPAQHERIAAYLEEIDKNSKGQISKVYKLRYSNPSSAYTVVSNLTPSATSVVDNVSNSLIVSATETDHEKIQKLIDEMEKSGTKEGESELKYYPILKADLNTAYNMLSQSYAQNPKVRITMDQRNSALAVIALPEYHERIATYISQIEDESKGVTSYVYRLKKTDPFSITPIVNTLTPYAAVVPEATTRSLVVSATEADHQKIKEFIEQIDTEEGNGLLLQAYEIKDAEANNVVTMLQNLFAYNREVRITFDNKNNTVVALASPDQHQQIVEFLGKIESKAKKLKTEIYRFQEADPSAAYSVLTRLLPKATFSYDQNNRTLLATASEEDHKIIAETVLKFDMGESSEFAPKLKVYPIVKADPSSLLTMLESLFRQNNDVKISLDKKNDAIVAIAPQYQQEKIQKIVDDVEKGATGKSASVLESYPLNNIKARSLMVMLRELFKSQTPAVELSIAPDSNMLLAIARTEQHAIIRSTIEKLKTTKPELEVFQLYYVDPFTAELAIDQLFDTYGEDSGGLSVDSDYDTDQLFVRGSEQQIEEIRKLLIKMGETQLQFQKSDKTSRIRVIPFSGKSEEALLQIQEIWPRLRKNKIKVVTPSAVAPYLRKSREENQKKQETPEKEPENKPAPAPEKKQENSMLERVGDKLVETQFVFFEEVDQVTEEETITIKEEPVKEKAETGKKDQAPDQKAETTDEPAPILVSPGFDSITIASDDLEALNQLETLLRNMAPRRNKSGTDFIIFQLKNSLAATVAKNLEELFTRGNKRNRNRDYQEQQTRIVPDERLNAIIVYGNQRDLESIEQLLEFLDTEDVSETFSNQKPYIIPVKNTQASRIETLVSEVYRHQLTQRPNNQVAFVVPTGVSPEVASALMQANTARSAPLLTLSVDELTNSIIVAGPKSLYEEIKELVEDLDEKAGNNTTRGITVIPLKKMNTRQMEKVLNRVLDSRDRSRSRRRNRD